MFFVIVRFESDKDFISIEKDDFGIQLFHTVPEAAAVAKDYIKKRGNGKGEYAIMDMPVDTIRVV